MSDFTPLGEIDNDVPVEPAIGDLWIHKKTRLQAHVTDVLPFTGKDEKPKPITHVYVLILDPAKDDRREKLTVAELRTRYQFRRRA